VNFFALQNNITPKQVRELIRKQPVSGYRSCRAWRRRAVALAFV
jgi:hypothetical protein